MINTLNGHSCGVWSVAFDNNDMLASGSCDLSIRLWDTDRGEMIRSLSGSSGTVWAVVFD